METAWNKVKIDTQTLIECLPTFLEKIGEFLNFGTECDSTPFVVERVRLSGRDCWVISDTAEDSPAFVMQCSKTTKGYEEDVKEWLDNTFGLGWEDDIWVNEKVQHDETQSSR